MGSGGSLVPAPVTHDNFGLRSQVGLKAESVDMPQSGTVSIRRRRVWPRRIRRWTANTLVASLVATVSTAAIVQVLDVGRFIPVLTDSMSPRYPSGTLVVVRDVESTDIKVGDVVVFQPPPQWQLPGGIPVVHRAVSFEDHVGLRLMRTKGDANDDEDPWKIDTATGEYQRVVYSVPYLGRVITESRGLVGYAAMAGGLGIVGMALVRAFAGNGRHRSRKPSPEHGGDEPVRSGEDVA